MERRGNPCQTWYPAAVAWLPESGRAGLVMMTSHQDVSASGQLVATLPLPAVVVPDFAGVRRAGERVAVTVSGGRGRHAAPRQSVLPKVFDGSRFLLFSAIGGFVFLLGFGLQAWLTSGLRVPADASYLAQAVLSIETSFALNRWLTWRDRDTPLLRAFGRFNAQKTVTVALNLALYAGLLWLGMNYLLANVVLTALFTVVNFVAGDRFVFVPAGSRLATRTHAAPKGRSATESATQTLTAPVAMTPAAVARRAAVVQTCPLVSVVIPCRDNESTIGAAVRSLLAQDYPGLSQIILVGSPGDRTWQGLAGITDRRLVTLEMETPPGLRDANYKRNAGIGGASGDLIALVDSDIVLPGDWLSQAVTALQRSDASCVAGGMRSIHDTYWGRYTDSTRLGAKTPRIDSSYEVTKATFGARGQKPPITANTLFTREMYDGCPIDASWSHGSYEDYEWFWRVVSTGYSVLVCDNLFGWHHHRRGIRPLIKEYRRSSRGCAFFVRAHPDCPLSRVRMTQAIGLPLAAFAGLVAAGAAMMTGYGLLLGVLALAAVAGLTADQVVQSRRLEAITYPLTGLTLGLVFTYGLITNLIKARPVMQRRRPPSLPPPPPPPFADPGAGSGQHFGLGAEALADGPDVSAMMQETVTPAQVATIPDPPAPPDPQVLPPVSEPDHRPARWRDLRSLLHPLTMICAMQAALSLTLIWSNTAFTDEADYLWIGRLVLRNWVHGSSWPASYGQQILPGSPLIYPPVGALAAGLGGLAGARLLSLGFMLGATVLLYFTASRLVGRTAAIFASALWVLTEPVLRLAFATADPLSVFLTALAAWLIVEAGHRRRHGEFVAASAALLALANATAYSGVVIDPIVIAFAFCAMRPQLGTRQAAYSTAWFTGAWTVFLGILLTTARSWVGFAATVSDQSVTTHQSTALVLTGIWAYAGLIAVIALVGVVVGTNSGKSRSPMFFAVLGCATLIVPVVQLAYGTTNLLDRHLAYGIWFAAIAAGYGCRRILRWIPAASKAVAPAFCALAIAYPGFAAWQPAWDAFHGWSNARSFIDAFTPLAAQSKGLFFVASQEHVAQYYSAQGAQWKRWSTGDLPLDPGIPVGRNYYTKQLHRDGFGLLALFYITSSQVHLPSGAQLLNGSSDALATLTQSASPNPQEPGLTSLTQALERNRHYRAVAIGRFDSAHQDGVFVIWQKVATR